MSRQPLMAKLICKYTPVYVDMNGRVYIGREIERTQIFELPNTSIIDMPPTNLCKTQTSGFGYARPQFGCNNVNSPTPTPNTREKRAGNLNAFFSSPASLRGLLADLLPGLTPLARRMVNLSPLIALPLAATLDVADGRGVRQSIKANAGGFGAGYLTNTAVAALTKHAIEVSFAARAATAGRAAIASGRIGKWGGALIGFIAGFFAYDFVSDLMHELPDSSDWADPWHDDWLFIPSP